MRDCLSGDLLGQRLELGGAPPLRPAVVAGLQRDVQLHLARSVVRRAERAGWAAAELYGTQTTTDGRPGGVNPLALAYLNRLSDLLFILARVIGQESGEVLWVPGKDREIADPKGARKRDRITRSGNRAGPTPAS